MSPAPVYVVAAVEAVIRADWTLARWCQRRAVLARVSALLDDGHEVEIPTATRLDADERPIGRMVGAGRGGP